MATTLIIAAAVVHGLLILNAILNFVYLRSGKAGQFANAQRRIQPMLSVLIPARNEEKNVSRLLKSLAVQSYSNFEAIVYDDDSDDATWQIVHNLSDDRIRGVKGSTLPEGWTGKVHACYRLSHEARGEVYLFLDADTELQDGDALARMVEAYKSQPDNTVVTGAPRFSGGGALLVSMVGIMVLGGMPWWMGQRVPWRKLTGLNGQCWMIEHELYHLLEPHEHVKGEVLEDILIGRYLHDEGFSPILVDFQSELAVFMYEDLAGAWQGFRKNSAEGLGKSLPGATFGLLLYVGLFIVAPVFEPVFLLSIYALKLMVDRAGRLPIWITLLAPVSYVLAALVTADSILSRARRRLEWKGRPVLQRRGGSA